MSTTLEKNPTSVNRQRRSRIGLAGIGVGLVLLVLGALAAHFTGLSETNSAGQEIYPRVPRCLPFEDGGSCWALPTIGQIIALIGSQILLASIVYGWVLRRPLTRGAVAAGGMVVIVEMLIFFGIVPNQWLSLARGAFQWTGFTKDVLVGAYYALMLGVVAVVAHKLQKRATPPTAAAPPRVSHFGRILVEGER